MKKKFYKRIADEIHEQAGVRKEDIWISLVDSAREDWSFGDGKMQYAPNWIPTSSEGSFDTFSEGGPERHSDDIKDAGSNDR